LNALRAGGQLPWREKGGASVTSIPGAFGPRLRALRTAKGLSLSELARRLYYSKGHVSRIETGAQMPSTEFARRCDAVLGAGGELAAMVPAASPITAPQRDHDRDDDDGTWIMTMAPDGSNSFLPLGRRDLLVGGTAILAGLAGGTGSMWPATRAAEGQLQQIRRLFDAARGLGQVAPPRMVLPMLVGQAQALRVLAADRHGRDAVEVATLSARVAEFAGWMAQEAGDNQAAAWWTGKAVRAATQVGDHHTATYALVRRALITLYQGNAEATVGFARQAQAASGTPPRILGLAAQREAQGHALAGNHDECMRALDRAADCLHAARADQPAGPVIGTSHVPDPVAVVTGWCLYDLGRPKDAAAVLDREIERIPATAVRARVRFGARQALAHAAAGELDRACELAQPMIGQAAEVGSATILADIRRLAATLRRWNSHEAVRALDPAFATALYRGAPDQ
jgi:transcriptional regulator with XRE-family HTH domain